MSSLTLILLSTCIAFAYGVYLPELQLCSNTVFLNKQLTKYGPTIQKAIDNANISDITFDDKVDGVRLQLNLTKLKQKLAINWKSNVIAIQNQQTFVLNSKNINLTLDGHIEYKLGVTPKQSGQIVIQLQKLEADTTLSFTQPHCETINSGIGFDIKIVHLFVNTDKISIKIQKKVIVDTVIKTLLKLLKSRLPGIIQKNAIQKGNPAISKITCSPKQQLLEVGQSSYVAIINTTNIPHFIDKQLYAQIDLTFINAVTNATNNQVQNDNLPQIDLFNGKTEISLLASSNFMNTVLWLVDNSKIIKKYINNSQLGPNPPIQLNTLNLSILLPGLMKWPKKQVYVGISTSNQFSHLYIRNGKIITALSVSIKFIVNNTGRGQTIPKCISDGDCIVACDLNATIPFSAAVHIDEGSVLRGLVHTVGIEELQVLASEFPIKIQGLKKILNTLIGSARPQINQQIQTGIKLDLNKVEKYDIEQVLMITKKDYAAIGMVFKKQK